MDSEHQQIKPWVSKLARLMDSQFRIPGTSIRFGLDPLIGLIPGVGDTATFLVGLAMFAEAARLRAGLGVYARMLGNLALDWVVGLIPGIDLVLDTTVKAHTRNARLLSNLTDRRETLRPQATSHSQPSEHQPT